MSSPKKNTRSVAPADKETGSSLYRQWQILHCLPNGKWIGTQDIRQKLLDKGIEISLRTIQRDLHQIAERFPIECKETTPKGWRWLPDAPMMSMPNMSDSQAVTFLMVEQHLRHLLPPSLLTEIEPWFSLAKKNVEQHKNAGKQWLNRVRIVPATQPLIPPSIDHNVRQIIYEALLKEKQIDCIYSGRNKNDDKSYTLNPLALVQRGAIIYLICTKAQDLNDIRTFAMHRFKSATLLDSRAIQPIKFNIDDYIEQGSLGFRIDSEQPTINVDLELTFGGKEAAIFFESKLTKNQKIEKIGDDEYKISANVPLNQQLIWWLRGYGKKLLHIEPQEVADLVWEK